MGYFSNGSEGDSFQAALCERCLHDVKQDCPVWLIHLMYNYNQCKNEDYAAILSAFIPRNKEGFNEDCKMFVDKTTVNLK